MFLLYLFAVFGFLSVKAEYFDYYWRDYYGVIPGDAFVGGKDINGHSIYIGQAYIHNGGLSVGMLSSGQKEISVVFNGVKKQDYLIKILCTKHPDNFYWLTVHSDTYHITTINKHAVMGGCDASKPEGKGFLHVGRINNAGILAFGIITAYNSKYPYLYYPDGSKERSATNFEVLIYNTTSADLTVN